MAGGRAAAKVALKGIAKPLEQLLKECEEVLAKDVAAAGRKAVTASSREAGESMAERFARTEAKELFERDYLAEKLRECDYNVARAAEASGIHPSGLHAKIKKFGIEQER